MPEYRGDVSQVAGAATVAANHEDPNNTSILKQIFSMLSPKLPKYLAEDLLALSGAPAGKAGRDKHDPIRHDPIRLAHLT